MNENEKVTIILNESSLILRGAQLEVNFDGMPDEFDFLIPAFATTQLTDYVRHGVINH